ncbi:hypothetical protein [Rubripirellula amarantea]|uniref:hypothetical protein n=1 Tax=Rubripirellula amarantea TaxID=2527999 RepID=UPI0013EF3B8B|nr:hypothetical protein [Rubripirellula amarantea]
MLAANVAASYSDGELVLAGSFDDDHLSIEANPATRHVIVRGRDGTLINGRSAIGFNAVSDFKVNLKGGENEIVMQSSTSAMAVFDTLNLRVGNGSDVVWVDKMRFTESSTIVTLRGDDLVVVSDSQLSNLRLNVGLGDDGVQLIDNRIDGSSRLVSEGGSDSIDIRSNTFLNSPLYDRFLISAGEGDDNINFVANTIRTHSDVWIDGGGGNNSGLIEGVTPLSFEGTSLSGPWRAVDGIRSNPGWIKYETLHDASTHDVTVTLVNGRANIMGTQFDDRIFVDTRLRSGGRQELTVRGLPGTTINGEETLVLDHVDMIVLSLFGGDDLFSMSDLQRGLGVQNTTYERFDVDLGGGDDFFQIVYPRVTGVFSVIAGDGDDYVSINRVDATQLVVEAGNGDDAVEVNLSSIDSLTVRGGEGSDTFDLINNNFATYLVTIHGEAGNDTLIWDQNLIIGDPLLIVSGGTGTDTLFYDNRNYRSGIRMGPSIIGSEFEDSLLDPFVWPDNQDPMSLHPLDYLWRLYGRLVPTWDEL